MHERRGLDGRSAAAWAAILCMTVIVEQRQKAGMPKLLRGQELALTRDAEGDSGDS